MKHQLTTSLRILIIYLLVVVALCIIASCNPVARVISNPKHYKTITEHVISSGACVNDTIIVSESDTLITFDTLFAIDFQTDTMTVDREIVRTNIVTKTVKIRDTVTKVITDNSKIGLLQKEVSKHLDIQIKLKQVLVNIEAEKKEMKQARNKWRLYFFILLAAFGVWIFRKPILKLISPIKL